VSSHSIQIPRGRPKTLDCQQILEKALKAYWNEGVDNTSINDICRLAKVSKPGLYREFGNQDGLMKAVILEYEKQVLTPHLKILAKDNPFRETLDHVISLVLSDKECLYENMRKSWSNLGIQTQEQIDRIHEEISATYGEWIERAKDKGEFDLEIPTKIAVTYIISQLSSARHQFVQGDKTEDVIAVLNLAFSVFL